jgi:hypothetical protein
MLAAEGAAAQQARPWTLQNVATVGGSEVNDDRYIFARVTAEALAGRGDGHLLVLDIQGKRILEYDAAGRHVRSFGREGDGPGEFRYPTAIALGGGDSVWAFDLGRISVFPPGGGSARMIPAATRTFGNVRLFSGSFARALSAEPGQAGGAGSLVPSQMHLARFGLDARLRDTLYTGPMPVRVLVSIQNGRSSFSTHAIEQYSLIMRWDQLRDGHIVIADTTAYVLRILSPEGKVLQTFGTGEAARPVTAADRERALDRLRAQQRRTASQPNPPPAELQRKVLEQTPFAAVVPRISGLRVDAQDRIWVGVSGTTRDLERIDIYDRSGRLVARIADPPGFPAVLYGDGMTALLELDEFDAQRIRIMRVDTR